MHHHFTPMHRPPSPLDAKARWVSKCAQCLIRLQPGITPLDAIRHAREVWHSASLLPPDEGAQLWHRMTLAVAQASST